MKIIFSKILPKIGKREISRYWDDDDDGHDDDDDVKWWDDVRLGWC